MFWVYSGVSYQLDVTRRPPMEYAQDTFGSDARTTWTGSTSRKQCSFLAENNLGLCQRHEGSFKFCPLLGQNGWSGAGVQSVPSTAHQYPQSESAVLFSCLTQLPLLSCQMGMCLQNRGPKHCPLGNQCPQPPLGIIRSSSRDGNIQPRWLLTTQFSWVYQVCPAVSPAIWFNSPLGSEPFTVYYWFQS